MAYTINYLYLRFLDKIDKAGTDECNIQQFMEIIESATYDFIEEIIKYNENTQQLRDALLPIFLPYEITLADNSSNPDERIGSLPESYLHLETAKVYDTSLTVRRTKLIRKGELDILEHNPDKKPSPEYPKVIQYGDYLAVYGNSTGPKVTGFYVKIPTFGDAEGDVDNEIVVNLPDVSVQKILLLAVSDVLGEKGDQRTQVALIKEQGFGKSDK